MKKNLKIGCEPESNSSFLSKEMFDEHKDDFIKIGNEIKEKLSNYPNYIGCDFCDVNAGGIQIRGHHKDIKNYTFGEQVTIKYDFSNIDKVADEFASYWKEADQPKNVSDYKRFLRMGEKYGWD